jgi:hypothetical protein
MVAGKFKKERKKKKCSGAGHWQLAAASRSKVEGEERKEGER